jgi:hypothetical protein
VTGLGDEQPPAAVRQVWLTWWKLAIVAFAGGAVAVAVGLLTGAGAIVVLVTTCAYICLGITFLALEVLLSISKSFGISGNGPRGNPIAVLPLVVLALISFGQAAAKYWPANGPEGSQVIICPREGSASGPCAEGGCPPARRN